MKALPDALPAGLKALEALHLAGHLGSTVMVRARRIGSRTTAALGENATAQRIGSRTTTRRIGSTGTARARRLRSRASAACRGAA
jgi:hypothetical protein